MLRWPGPGPIHLWAVAGSSVRFVVSSSGLSLIPHAVPSALCLCRVPTLSGSVWPGNWHRVRLVPPLCSGIRYLAGGPSVVPPCCSGLSDLAWGSICSGLRDLALALRCSGIRYLARSRCSSPKQTVLGGLAWFHHSILSCCGSCGNPTPAESVLPSARVRSRWWPASVWLLRLAPPLASPAWMDAPRFSPSPRRRTSPVLVAAARGAAASSAGVCCGCLGRSLLQGFRPLARPGLGVPAFRLASPPPALLRNSFPGWSVSALLRYSLPGWR